MTRLLKLAFVLAVACGAPLLVRAQSGSAPAAFASATVRPSNAQGWRSLLIFTGYTAAGINLHEAVEEAYGIYDIHRIIGGPKWVSGNRFDIDAKIGIPDDQLHALTVPQRQQMLQQLLADRFHLIVHHELREYPIYNLVVDYTSPNLKPAGPEDVHVDDVFGIKGLIDSNPTGSYNVRGFTMTDLAAGLTAMRDNVAGVMEPVVGRTVVDQTGLTGRYNLALQWTPETALPASPAGGNPSILTAIQQQLGLRLAPNSASLDTIVIDHAELPAAN